MEDDGSGDCGCIAVMFDVRKDAPKTVAAMHAALACHDFDVQVIASL